LRKGKIIGRLDAKAHRREQQFEIKALHLEPAIKPNPALGQDLAAALQRCADWHACPQVRLADSIPSSLRSFLQTRMEPS
jgi:uncharacterized protein YcaQ